MARRIKIIMKVVAVLLAFLAGETAIAETTPDSNGFTEVTYFGPCLERAEDTFTRWRPSFGSESCEVIEAEDFDDADGKVSCVQTVSCSPIKR